jgi:uncharacterized protein (TIGR03437 family)
MREFNKLASSRSTGLCCGLLLPLLAIAPLEAADVSATVRFARPVVGVSWIASERAFARLVGVSGAASPERIEAGDFTFGAVAPRRNFALAGLAASGQLVLLDLDHGRMRELPVAPGVRAVEFSPAGTAAALLRNDAAEVEVLTDFLSGEEGTAFPLRLVRDVARVAVSDDGAVVAVVSAAGEVAVLYGGHGISAGRFSPPVALQFAPGTRDLAVVEGPENDVTVLTDVAGALVRRPLSRHHSELGAATAIAYSRDGHSLYVAGTSGLLLAVDANSGVWRETRAAAPLTMLRALDGNAVFQVAESADGRVLVADMDLATPRIGWSSKFARAVRRSKDPAPVRYIGIPVAAAGTADAPGTHRLIANGAPLAPGQATATQSSDTAFDVWVQRGGSDVTTADAGAVDVTYTILDAEQKRFGVLPTQPILNRWDVGGGPFTIPVGKSSVPVGLTKWVVAAGKYSFTVRDNSGNAEAPIDLTIPETKPLNVKCSQSGSTLTITGATPTLELTTLALTFGNTTVTATPLDISKDFSDWFKTSGVEPYGAFSFTTTLTPSSGTAADVQSASVTLRNSIGPADTVACQSAALTPPSSLPKISSSQITNGYSYAAGPIAPFETVTIFGVNLPKTTTPKVTITPATGPALSATVVLPTSDTQWNVVLPAIPTDGAVQLSLGDGTIQSNTVTLQTAPAAPGINGDGNRALNTQTTPFGPQDQISFYVTGEGATSNGLPVLDVQVRIDGVQTKPAITYVQGIMKVTVGIPDGVATGRRPLVITIGNVPSPPVFIYLDDNGG